MQVNTSTLCNSLSLFFLMKSVLVKKKANNVPRCGVNDCLVQIVQVYPPCEPCKQLSSHTARKANPRCSAYCAYCNRRVCLSVLMSADNQSSRLIEHTLKQRKPFITLPAIACKVCKRDFSRNQEQG